MTQPRLAVLGVGPDGEQLYRQVLRSPGLTLPGYVARLGWADYEGDRALEQLRARRLVRVNEIGELTADHPRAALERLLSAEEARLATRRQDLALARDAIDAYVADHRIGQQVGEHDHPVRERVDPASVVAVHEHLAASTDGPIRLTCPQVRRRPDELPTVRSMVGDGREQRVIHLPAALDDTAAQWAELGEQQRVVEHLPSEFVCFGDVVALASTEWGRSDGDLVVLRDPIVVAALVELFDRLWVSGAQVAVQDDVEHEALIDLMRQGLKDEAMARVLGVSLRTVRRRVSTLMAEHGVDTRFQLALAIASRGRAGSGSARPDGEDRQQPPAQH